MDTKYAETHVFFETLPADFRHQILAEASELLVPSGTTLFAEDTPAEDFYLLESGSIEVTYRGDTRKASARILQPGDLVGWSWLVPPYLWTVTGVALEDCRVFRFDGLTLLRHCEDNPAFGYALLKRFAGMMGQRLADLHDVGYDKKRAPIERTVMDAVTQVEDAIQERRRNLAI